jgi:hypothetical protein
LSETFVEKVTFLTRVDPKLGESEPKAGAVLSPLVASETAAGACAAPKPDVTLKLAWSPAELSIMPFT